MPSLLNMPDVAMNLILKKLDFQSILNLRKSCHALRDFINDVKPEAELQEIHVNAKMNFVRFRLFCTFRTTKIITYHNAREACLVEWTTSESVKQKSLPDSNYIDRACKDLQTLLELKTSGVLRHLNITLNYYSTQFLDSFVGALEAKRELLNVFDVYMDGFNLNQVVAFLPFLNSKKLELITIHARGEASDSGFSKVSVLEQWKCAKEISFLTIQEDTNLEHFVHCEKVFVSVNELSVKMILALKEKLLSSPSMIYFTISLNQFNSKTKLIEMLGEPCNDDYSVWWYFGIPNCSAEVLCVVLVKDREVVFKRMQKDRVVENAYIY